MTITCPSPDDLQSLLAGETPGESLTTIEHHLTECEDCRHHLDAITNSSLITQWLRRDRPNAYPYLTPADRPGDLGRIGRFLVESEIGRGGMGIVFRAFDGELRRPVALKVLRIGRDDERAVERFVRESRVAGSLRHDHLVPILDVIRTDDGRPVLVMPLINGPTLRDTIRQRQTLPPRDAARIIRDVADGLEAIHRAGLIHRDVKPANILLDAIDGRAKLSDFGLARMIEPGETFTQDGTVVGTPEYLSPEQAHDAARADVRSDVYSLGITFYECLTGVVPFRGSAFDVIGRHRSEEPVPLRQLTAVPPDLETICLTCLAKTPGRRYPSAADVREDLDRWFDGRPIRARPLGGLERSVRWARRNPWPVGLLLVSLVGLVVASAGWRRAYVNEGRANAREHDAKRNLELANERAQIAIDSVNTLISKSRNLIGDPPGLLAFKAQLNEAALVELRRLTTALNDLPGAENAALQAHQKVGDAFHLLGRTDEAEGHWKRVVTIGEARIATHPLDRITARELAKGYVSFGDVKNRRADFAGAASLFERAIGVLTPVHEQFPDDVQIEDSLGFSWGHRGEVWLNGGKPREAIECFTIASRHVRNALSRAPDNVFIQSNAHALTARLGIVRLTLVHDYAGAESTFRELLTSATDRIERDPDNVIWRRNERMTRLDLAVALQRQGRYAESVIEVRTALPPLAAVATAEPDNRSSQRDHALAWQNLGEALLGQRRYDEAERSFGQSLAILNRTTARGTRATLAGPYLQTCQGILNASVRAGHFRTANEIVITIKEFIRGELAESLSAQDVESHTVRCQLMTQTLGVFPAAIRDPTRFNGFPDFAAANAIWIRTFHLVEQNEIDVAKESLRRHVPEVPNHFFIHLARAIIDAKVAERETNPKARRSQIESGCSSLIRALRQEPATLSILHMCPELDVIRTSPDFQTYLNGLHPQLP